VRFVIYGAGGVGGVMGVRLIQHGHDVVFIARGEHLRVMQSEGLKFRSPSEDLTLPVEAVGHPTEVDFGPGDVVLLTMKSQHTQSALLDLRHAAGDDVPVICAQNGVANERAALRLFANVYAMLVILPASHLEPGVVSTQAATATGIVDTGAFPNGIDELIAEVATTLDGSGFSCRADPSVMRWKYAKLLGNLNNALNAVAGTGSDAATEIGRQMRHEALACFEAAGIDCATAQEVRERRDGVMEYAPVAGQERSGSSSWQSLERGTGNIEADYLNGEIVQLGRLHGVPTPVNGVLQCAANELARAGSAPGSISAEELRLQIDTQS